MAHIVTIESGKNAGNKYIATDEQTRELDNKNKALRVYKSKLGRAVKRLNDEQCGQLLRALLEYSQTWEVPDISDDRVAWAFEDIQEGMDIDRKSYWDNSVKNAVNKGSNKYALYQEGINTPVVSSGNESYPVDTDIDKDKEKDKEKDKGIYTDRGVGETNNPIETIEEAQTVFVNSCSKHNAPNNCMNYLIFKIQEEYTHGVFYTAALLDDMARNAEQLCNDIKRGRA